MSGFDVVGKILQNGRLSLVDVEVSDMWDHWTTLNERMLWVFLDQSENLNE
jgi:hypothetical protein